MSTLLPFTADAFLAQKYRERFHQGIFLLACACVLGGAVGFFVMRARPFLALALFAFAFLVYWKRGQAPETFRASAWLALEQARMLAQTLKRPLGVGHLALSAFATQEGAMVLARLGITFEALQGPFLSLVRDGEVVETEETTAEVEALLARACEMGKQEGRGCGALEILRVALSQEYRLRDALSRAGAEPNHIEAIGRWLAEQARLKQEHDTFVRLAMAKPDSDLNRTMTARRTMLLNQISEDLTRFAKHGAIAPAAEREEVWNAAERAWKAGSRVVVLVGEEGVGKTAWIEGLARRMVEERVPNALMDKRLVSVHVAELVTGADAGTVSERLLQMANEVAMSGNVVLVLEGIEGLAGAGYGGTRDLMDVLSNELERLGLFVVATTTPAAWVAHIERKTFGRRAIKIAIEAPNPLVGERILIAHAGGIEYKHNLFFSYAAIAAAMKIGKTLHTGLAFPGNAIEWLREAGASVASERGMNALITQEDLGKIIEEKTGVPTTSAGVSEADTLLDLERRLLTRVIGQDEAVRVVAGAMRRARAGVRHDARPIASFLFLGPTGVGKTELAKALAAEYFGDAKKLVRLDCSEYQAASSLARLIGFPQDERGGLLTEAIRQKPYSLLLLDELEKAHPDILTLFLQVLDDGRLTDGMGRTIDFSHVIIIATSNAAAGFIQESIHAGMSSEAMKRALMERELRSLFRPEFLNRFDGVEVFKPLTLDAVTRIAWIMLHEEEKQLLEQGITFRAEDVAVEKLAHDGYDPQFGARPLRRLIQDRIQTAIADLLLKKEARRGDTLVLRESGQVEVE